MSVRIFASVFIILGCGYMGIVMSMGYRRRVNQLVELLNVIKQLEFDIDFLGMPICEALERGSGCTERAIGDMLGYISGRLKENPCEDMEKLWKRAIDRYSFELFLGESDIGILIDFSKSLGCGDCEKEKGNLKMTSMRLKIAEEEARAMAKSNMKMYRGLGFLLGVFIVIVFI